MSLLDAARHYLETLSNTSHSLAERDAAHEALAAAVADEESKKSTRKKAD
jgi:hypothetical protein